MTFKTKIYTPTAIDEPAGFEDDLISVLDEIKFRSIKTLQKILALEVKKKKELKMSPKLFIKGANTKNIYDINPKEYNKKIIDEITRHYKKKSTSIGN